MFDVPLALLCGGEGAWAGDGRLRERVSAWADAGGAWPDQGLPPLWLEELRACPEWSAAPWVAGPPEVRFYASAPLGGPGGGRLALLDFRPRTAEAQAVERLVALAAVASQCLELEREAAEAAQEAAQFRLLAEASTDTIVRGDLDGVRRYISPSVRTLLGYEPAELIGQRAMELTHPDDLPAFAALMRQVREGSLEFGVSEQRQRHKNGSWVWLEACVRLTRDPVSGVADGYVSSVRGIGRRKAMELQLQDLAARDALTGLPNRVEFDRRLEAAVARMKADEKDFLLLYMDVDRFKQVNDSLGHRAGDALLREMAERLRAVLREQDCVARLGGDEFTAIIPLGLGDAAGLSERLIQAARRPFAYEGAAILVGLSIGIASAPAHGVDAGGLLSAADQALYAAKRAGRGTFRIFGDSA
ncbi:sensor domain-containing diguanylate cyclase [Azoarcus sp. TTM-91]|uniref:sensor domain-containing diguanylate cyclase n=1 Tax=Azoarcus sp. TTM-91 TaxID=2691581 RepID=UPI00145D2100|nr:sensor domain-containing diguanylate cyclase [Azoarcus sp. TTM-91]